MRSSVRGARTRLGLAVVAAAIGCLAGAQSAAAVPAETTIAAGPADASKTRDNTPTFEFSANQANVTFTCSIDSAELTTTFACSSPYTTPPLADGGHVFRVSATNSVAEIDPSPASRSFTIDATPPETTITSGPAEGEVIDTDAPAFSWASSETDSTFACIADGVALTSCDLAFATGASAGEHTLSIAATDAAGNTDPTPATRSFKVSLTGAPPPIPRCLYDGKVTMGTTRADTRIGTPRTDLMFGLGGNDVLSGVGGPDCITGQGGNDRLRGGKGDDLLLGGAGNDRLSGDAGSDELRGGLGNDTISGGAGVDNLFGEYGADRLTDTNGVDAFSGGPGNDRIDARDSSLFGRRGRDTVICGTGSRDVALVDRSDRVSGDCEIVTRR
jgi:Ca2+-binding RTX toxin-like protein